jgi:predicted MFS family arabinose efflux permease
MTEPSPPSGAPADAIIEPLPRRSFAILFAVSAVTAVGNTGLISILPAISREIGIADALGAAVFSLSALLWALSSPYWARQSDRFGRKPLILIGMAGFTVSMLLCGFVVSAGLVHWGTPTLIFVLFLFARAIFGAFGSASNPASQAYLAERTSRADRTKTMSGLAGAFGLGTVIGPFAASSFVLPALGQLELAAPLFAFAAIAALIWFAVYRLLPAGPSSQAQTGGKPLDRGGPNFWRDPRVLPFLIYGFLVATCQTAQQQTLGFLIIDRVNLQPSEAQPYITQAMMFGAMAGLFAQWGIIRIFDLGPKTLMRSGVAVATVGTLMIAFSATHWTAMAGYALASLGFGLARPGFTAGASLSVNMGEQARAAGLIASVNGLNVILAPAFVFAYEHYGPLPFLLTSSILVGLLVYAFRQPTLRNVSAASTPEDAAVTATLERRDEGS